MSAGLALMGEHVLATALRQVWLAAIALSPTGEQRGGAATDADLVEEARRGDPRALHALYHRYAADVYRRLTHLVGADAEREDLMQEAFVDLFRQLDAFRGEAGLRTYLLRIVANKAYDHLRARRRRSWEQSTAAEAPTAEVATHAPSPEDRVRARQELALVRQAIEGLAPKKRIAYLLRVVEGLSLKEIADQVGSNVFAVAQRIRHAEREIHRFMEAKP